MRLHLVSDLHLEFFPFDLPDTKADAILLAGDIGLHTHGLEWAIDTLGGRGKPILYVSGNHESYGAELHGLTRELKKRAEAARSQGVPVWVLDNDEVILGDVRFLGCTFWTDYELYGAGQPMGSAMTLAKRAMADHRVIRCAPLDRFTPSQARELHLASVRWLNTKLDTPFPGKTVVMTHHLPSAKCVIPQFKGDLLSPAFASNRDDLVKKADIWAFGHTHANLNLRVGNCQLVANPRGYMRQRPWGLEVENPAFDPAFVIDLPT